MENTTLVALKPSEMAPAQASLADWCFDKMKALGKEYADYRASLVIATRNRWGSRQSLQRAVSTTKARIAYYRKIREAVLRGYVVIPNFDIDVIAIRVDGQKPRFKSNAHLSYEINHAPPDLLPPGEGRYVSEKTDWEDNRWERTNQQTGKIERGGNVVRSGYIEEIDFPMLELKPQVLESLEVALREKVFDRIGVVKHVRRSDPILVGQLLDPRQKMYRTTSPTVISFFIAWWLDTASL